MRSLFFIGSKGVGKTTIAGLFEQRLGYKVLRFGVLLRELAKTNEVVRKCVNNGLGVPAEINKKIWIDFMEQSSSDPVIIDGNPYSAAHLENSNLAILKYRPNILVVEFLASRKTLLERLGERSRFDQEKNIEILDTFERDVAPIRHGLVGYEKRLVMDADQSIEDIYTQISKNL